MNNLSIFRCGSSGGGLMDISDHLFHKNFLKKYGFSPPPSSISSPLFFYPTLSKKREYIPHSLPDTPIFTPPHHMIQKLTSIFKKLKKYNNITLSFLFLSSISKNTLSKKKNIPFLPSQKIQYKKTYYTFFVYLF